MIKKAFNSRHHVDLCTPDSERVKHHVEIVVHSHHSHVHTVEWSGLCILLLASEPSGNAGKFANTQFIEYGNLFVSNDLEKSLLSEILTVRSTR